MMSNTEQLQHGECCCCLEKGDHRELTKQYYLDKQPEIYEVIFKDTFNIVLKYPESTKLICDICIEQLRQARHFRFMVESIQQRLSDRVNWQPEFDNVKEDPLELLNTESIKYESDYEMEEADNDVQPSVCTIEELNYDVEETDIKEENSDPSTSSSDKLPITRHSMKTLKVLLTRSPTVEQLLSYDSNCQYKQLAAPLYRHNRKDKRFVCNLCPYKSVHKGNMNRHLHTHSGDKPFACDICQYKTADRTHLAIHIRTHTGEKQFSCDKCPYKTVYKSHLARHLRNHTRGNKLLKPFSCDICKYRAATTGQITTHMSIHTGEKLFVCHICQYKTPLHGHLIRHIRTHTGEKPFSCNICEFKTAEVSNLSRHVRTTHTGLRPFSCELCQYKTTRKSILAIHIRTHTGEKPFSCDICQYKATQKSSLTQHLLTHKKKKCKTHVSCSLKLK